MTGEYVLQTIEEIKQLLPKKISDCAGSVATKEIEVIFADLDSVTNIEIFKILNTEEKRMLARMSDNLFNRVKYYQDILDQESRAKYQIPKTVKEFRRLAAIIEGEDKSHNYPPEAEIVAINVDHPEYGETVAFLLKRKDYEQGTDIGFLLKGKLYREKKISK